MNETLRSQRFRRAREDQWRTLDRLVERMERESPATLTDAQLLAIPVLYRAALSSLSVARATSLDRNLIAYLESLCTRAYFFVYGPRTTLRERIWRFFVHDWPGAARAMWRETLVAFALMMLGAGVAYALTVHDPGWYSAFIPGSLAGGRTPESSTAALRAVLYSDNGRNWLAVFAAFLFTHNAQISIMAFALGFAFCVPTAALITSNGCALGALFALYGAHGLSFQLGGWIFIHGVTELWAVTLSGAAGFRIGWRFAFPGQVPRLAAVGEAGRQGAVMMFGVIAMLAVAGLLEGLGRQLITSDLARYGVAASSALVWGVYLYAPRPKRSVRA
ncbi:MAG: stage II sporulation protein M [Caulobacteraceae bacterium]